MNLLKRLPPLFLALCVLGVAVLGFFAMADMNNHVLSSCIGSITGANCPIATLSFTDIASHVSTVQTLLLSTFNPTLLSIFVLVLFLLVSSILRLDNLAYSKNPHSALFLKLQPSPSFHRYQRWLSLHEERDPSHTR